MTADRQDADVFLFTHYQYNFNGVVGSEEILTPYANVIRVVAGKYGCTIVELFSESGVHYELIEYFASDEIHRGYGDNIRSVQRYSPAKV